jgi:hypothetical protein
MRLAAETGLWVTSDERYEAVRRFAELVAAAEREACAKLMGKLTCMGDAKECFEVAATYIRARGQS